MHVVYLHKHIRDGFLVYIYACVCDYLLMVDFDERLQWWS